MTRGPGRPRNPPLPAFPRSPLPAVIRAARMQSGLTQRGAGAVVYTTGRTWEMWEYGRRPMSPAIWELWLLKTARVRARARPGKH